MEFGFAEGEDNSKRTSRKSFDTLFNYTLKLVQRASPTAQGDNGLFGK